MSIQPLRFRSHLTRHLAIALGVAVLVAGGGTAAAQSAPPDAYTLTETSSLIVPGQQIEIARDGSKAMVETAMPARTGGSAGVHARSVFDLSAHTNHTWDLADPAEPCTTSTFTGDWGDPFLASANMTADFARQHATRGSTATVDGLTTMLTVPAGPGDAAGMTAWVDPRFGLVVKLENDKHVSLLEVTRLALGKPAASLFVLPPSCAALHAPPAP